MSLMSGLSAWDRRALESRRWMALESLLIFAAFALLHWSVFGGAPAWTDPDAPYHHLLQAEIHQHGWWRDVTWLPHTILREAGPDHHWLWHLLLSPFSAIDDLGTRIDVVNAFSFALVPAFTNLAFRIIGIRFAPLWILLVMAGTNWTLFRWSMARAQNPACVLMILFIAALARRHKPSLLLLPFVFMHTYHGAAILAAPGVFYFGARWLREKSPDWPLLALPAVGGALALITSPWYPHNIEYFLFHTIDKVGNSLDLNVGGEWRGTSFTDLLRHGLLPQAVVLTLVLIGAGRTLRHHLSTLTLAVLGTLPLFLFFATSHIRFVEYCPQIMVLAAALVVRDCHANFSGRIRPPLIAAAILAALVVLVLSLMQASQARHKKVTYNLDYHQDVGQFLTRFAAPGSLIVNTRWDSFPTLAWHAPTLRFLCGLDPYYLAYEDPERFIALEKLNGKFASADGSMVNVRADFGSDWVVTDKIAVAKYLARSGQAPIVMHSKYNYVIYVGTDPAMPDRLATEGRRWLDVYWQRPDNNKKTP